TLARTVFRRVPESLGGLPARALGADRHLVGLGLLALLVGATAAWSARGPAEPDPAGLLSEVLAARVPEPALELVQVQVQEPERTEVAGEPASPPAVRPAPPEPRPFDPSVLS